MKALMLVKNGEIFLWGKPMPVPGEHEVVAKVRDYGICGSVMGRLMHGGAYHYPLVKGHEFAGTLEQLDANVTFAREGDPVTVFPMLEAGLEPLHLMEARKEICCKVMDVMEPEAWSV